MKNKKPTLCWSCAKAGGGNVSECPWAREFKPVEGWTATETHLSNGERSKHYTSYHVTACPLYEKEEERKTVFDELGQKKPRKQKAIEATDDVSRIKIEVANELNGMKGNERAKARRAALKRRGVCVTCSAAFATKGFASCSKCLNYFAERHRKAGKEKAHFADGQDTTPKNGGDRL